jgi:hypothetical protein
MTTPPPPKPPHYTEPWAPGLADTARHIPTRTRDTRTPGSDQLLGTFTPYTTPDDGQAQKCIDAAVQWVLSQTGPLPAGLDFEQQARTAAEWRSAADIEIAYPNRDADIRLYQLLDQRAKDALSSLIVSIKLGGDSIGSELEGAGQPSWRAPAPPPWADIDPDYRGLEVRYIGSTGVAAPPPRTRARTHIEPGGG